MVRLRSMDADHNGQLSLGELFDGLATQPIINKLLGRVVGGATPTTQTTQVSSDPHQRRGSLIVDFAHPASSVSPPLLRRSTTDGPTPTPRGDSILPGFSHPKPPQGTRDPSLRPLLAEGETSLGSHRLEPDLSLSVGPPVVLASPLDRRVSAAPLAGIGEDDEVASAAVRAEQPQPQQPQPQLRSAVSPLVSRGLSLSVIVPRDSTMPRPSTVLALLLDEDEEEALDITEL